MCTAVSFKKDHLYFGRNLDLHLHYNEAVVITPSNFELRNPSIYDQRSSMIGIATVVDNYPLYYDAINEHGLCIAALNFPGNAVYHSNKKGFYNIPSFELIPWLLSNCKNVSAAKKLLKITNILNTSLSHSLPASPLHWMLCDETESIVIESVAEGLEVYQNPIGILTNNPPFPYHVQNLNNYLNVTSNEATNRFSPNLQITPYSFGMGGFGLPGDLSSASRFVRAAFVKENSACDNNEISCVNQFFHILESVSQPQGCVRLHDGLEKTIYSSCCNASTGVYYYKTYNNSQISAVKLHNSRTKQNELDIYPLRWNCEIQYENEAIPFY